MSQFSAEYEVFFASPAGISLLTWLQEQRTNEHERAEDSPTNAPYAASTARAYRQVLEHIDSIQEGIGKSPYSSGRSERKPQPVPIAPSTGLGTSQLNEG